VRAGCLVAAKDGKGPAAERDAAKTALTVRELSERYLTEHAAERKTPRSSAEDRRNINNHVVPLLGRLLVKDVSRADVERFMIRVRAGATACDEKIGPRARRIVRGGPIAANRCYALLSKMMNLAERWGIRPDGSNPCRHVERNRERRRERFLSAGELGRLGKTLAEAEHTATESASVIAAIRLLIFTGARRSEILTARWEHFDEENRCPRIAAAMQAENGPSGAIIQNTGTLSMTESGGLAFGGQRRGSLPPPAVPTLQSRRGDER